MLCVIVRINLVPMALKKESSSQKKGKPPSKRKVKKRRRGKLAIGDQIEEYDPDMERLLRWRKTADI